VDEILGVGVPDVVFEAESELSGALTLDVAPLFDGLEAVHVS